MPCTICGRPHDFSTCREIGLDCDEKRLKKIDDAHKAAQSVRPIDYAKTYSDKLRDAELMMGDM